MQTDPTPLNELEEANRLLAVANDALAQEVVEHRARLAAVEAIGAEFAAVGPEQSLTELVQACTSDLVIVDTSGSSSPEELAGLAANVTNRAAWVLACIPAGVSELETEATITRLGGLRPTGLIITKLDECHRPTALAAAPAISGLPVHAITNGPRVPEDIAPATMSGLLDALSGPTAPSASRPRTARAA